MSSQDELKGLGQSTEPTHALPKVCPTCGKDTAKEDAPRWFVVLGLSIILTPVLTGVARISLWILGVHV